MNEQIDTIKQQLYSLETTIIHRFEQTLGLTFITEQNQSNVCFAHLNDELQDAYKQVFYDMDLQDYYYALLHSTSYDQNVPNHALNKANPDYAQLPVATQLHDFWQLVKLGRQLRQQHYDPLHDTKITISAIDVQIAKINNN